MADIKQIKLIYLFVGLYHAFRRESCKNKNTLDSELRLVF